MSLQNKCTEPRNLTLHSVKGFSRIVVNTITACSKASSCASARCIMPVDKTPQRRDIVPATVCAPANSDTLLREHTPKIIRLPLPQRPPDIIFCARPLATLNGRGAPHDGAILRTLDGSPGIDLGLSVCRRHRHQPSGQKSSEKKEIKLHDVRRSRPWCDLDGVTHMG